MRARPIRTMRNRKGQPVHGWLVLDKPVGLSSAQAVGKVRYLLNAAKAGHAGTLDPLATGILPIACGEATKTMNFVVDGDKSYRFTVKFGESTATDDREGEILASSAVRPSDATLVAALPGFIGLLAQIPPIFSALKVGGARAYDLARAGIVPELPTRQVRIDALRLIDRPDADHAVLEVDCGKGTYVRSLARDLAKALGTLGHVVELRRLKVGRFTLETAISLDELAGLAHTPAVERLLLPIETALDDIPALALTDAEAHRLRQGQTVALLGRPDLDRLLALQAQLAASGREGDPTILALAAGRLVALARLESGQLRPVRVINQS
jgi:tRNA pseudouridine55 synthase